MDSIRPGISHQLKDFPELFDVQRLAHIHDVNGFFKVVLVEFHHRQRDILGRVKRCSVRPQDRKRAIGFVFQTEFFIDLDDGHATFADFRDAFGEQFMAAIEEFDAQLPRLMALNPDVIMIGGDHSSPAVMKSHSWHPVPLLLYSRYARSNGISMFGETICRSGSLGIISAQHVMPLALAHAGGVAKFGA